MKCWQCGRDFDPGEAATSFVVCQHCARPGVDVHGMECVSALVQALRETHRHVEELARNLGDSLPYSMVHEASERAKMLTEQIIALSRADEVTYQFDPLKLGKDFQKGAP